MLVAITGNLGEGKTLCMTEIGYAQCRLGRSIYTNYDVGFPHELINTLEDMEQMQGSPGKPAVALFDELWRWLDSRQFKKQKNDILSKIIFYSRKRDMDIFYTTQRFHQIEKRIRDVTACVIEPKLLAYKNISFEGKMQEMPLKCIASWKYIDPKATAGYQISAKPFKVHNFFTLPIMKLYNTRHEVQAIDYEKN